MREAQRERLPLAAGETKPSDKGVTLMELVQRARNSAGQEQVWLATLINQRLKKVTELPEREVLATFLLEQLDDMSFAGLKDKKHWPCRAAAVEAVIELGYPHALQLEPADVEYLAAEKAKRPTALAPMRIAAGLGIAAALFFGVPALGRSSFEAAAAGAVAAGNLGLLLSHPSRWLRRGLEVAGLLGSGLLSLWVFIFGHSFASPDAMLAMALMTASTSVLSFIEWRLQPR